MPRFLIKGFYSRFERDNYFSWVYSKYSDPYETNIVNIAVIKRFYSDKALDADEKITDLESYLGEFVHKLRGIENNTTFHDEGMFPEL